VWLDRPALRSIPRMLERISWDRWPGMTSRGRSLWGGGHTVGVFPAPRNRRWGVSSSILCVRRRSGFPLVETTTTGASVVARARTIEAGKHWPDSLEDPGYGQGFSPMLVRTVEGDDGPYWRVSSMRSSRVRSMNWGPFLPVGGRFALSLSRHLCCEPRKGGYHILSCLG
jgi:hypothetical protein